MARARRRSRCTRRPRCPTRDSVWWAELAPVDDPGRVAEVLASAVGLNEGGPAIADVLVGELADRRGLLVVDNCEPVLDAVAELLTVVIARCPNVAALATSREILDLTGEHTIRVRPLGLPADDRVTVGRAGGARGNGAVPRPRRFGFHAARGRRGRAAGGPRVSATGRSACCCVRSRRHWRGCRPSPGTFDLSAGLHVLGLGELGSHAALGLLTALVDKSLVAVREDREHRRYRLLEPIRQHAALRLEEADGAMDARNAHLAHHRRRFAEALVGLWSPSLTRLHGTMQPREELDDLRALTVLDNLGARNLRATLWSISGTASPFLMGDTEATLEAFDRGRELVGPPGSSTHAVAAALEGLIILWRDGPDAAEQSARVAHAILSRTSHRWFQTYLTLSRTWILIAQGDREAAQELVEETARSMPAEPVWPSLRGLHHQLLAAFAEEPAEQLRVALEPLDELVAGRRMLAARPLVMAASAALLELGRGEDAARSVGVAGALAPGWEAPFLLSLALGGDLRTTLDDDLGVDRSAQLVAEGRALGATDGVRWLLRGRGPHARAAVGWEALTPTERDVAASVADGNTNAAVADELFISVNTVKTHLKSIYAKLGIGSRVELVTVVAATTQ